MPKKSSEKCKKGALKSFTILEEKESTFRGRYGSRTKTKGTRPPVRHGHDRGLVPYCADRECYPHLWTISRPSCAFSFAFFIGGLFTVAFLYPRWAGWARLRANSRGRRRWLRWNGGGTQATKEHGPRWTLIDGKKKNTAFRGVICNSRGF